MPFPQTPPTPTSPRQKTNKKINTINEKRKREREVIREICLQILDCAQMVSCRAILLKLKSGYFRSIFYIVYVTTYDSSVKHYLLEKLSVFVNMQKTRNLLIKIMAQRQ